VLCNVLLNTSIACTLVCLPGMTSSLAKANKSSGAHFLALFLKFPNVLMFLNIQMDLLILKTYYGPFTLTTKKSLHIIFISSPGGFTAIVLSRLDYGSSVLFGLPQQLVDKLQSVQNAAARLIHAARRRDRIKPLLLDLHWLWVANRIAFRSAVLTYRCLHSSAHEYLWKQLQRVS